MWGQKRTSSTEILGKERKITLMTDIIYLYFMTLEQEGQPCRLFLVGRRNIYRGNLGSRHHPVSEGIGSRRVGVDVSNSRVVQTFTLYGPGGEGSLTKLIRN